MVGKRKECRPSDLRGAIGAIPVYFTQKTVVKTKVTGAFIEYFGGTDNQTDTQNCSNYIMDWWFL